MTAPLPQCDACTPKGFDNHQRPDEAAIFVPEIKEWLCAHCRQARVPEEDNIYPEVPELIYHSDYAFAEHPLQAISLHALEVVDGASSTRFVSSVAAHQALPAKLRARAEALDADFVAPATEVQGIRACDTRPEHQLLHERRRVIQRHPATREPYIAVNEMQTAGILDVEPADGKAMLEALFGVLYRPENLYEHRWMTGDIVIWDNLALQHARGDLSSVGRRELQRVCCGVSLYDMYPELDAKY